MQDKQKMPVPSLPPEAYCVKCGCHDLSPLPKFVVGSGTAYAPFNEGCLCRKCGWMGAYGIGEENRPAKKFVTVAIE
jgi:hypothetical protein